MAARAAARWKWLPRLVGRARTVEIVLSGDDFDADIAECYGWVNRTLDDDDLDSFVDALVRRVTSFDREASSSAVSNTARRRECCPLNQSLSEFMKGALATS